MAGLLNIAGASALPAPCPAEEPIAKGAAKGSIFHKTVMCRFYKAGKCTKGRHCSFAHNKVERNGRPELGKTKMCPMLSSCMDPKCMYAHARAELLKLDAEVLKSESIRKPRAKQAAFDLDTLTAKATALAAAVVSTGQEQDMVFCTAPFNWDAALAAALPEKILTHSSLATTSAASSLVADDSDSAGDFSELDAALHVPEEAQPVYLSFNSSGALLATVQRPTNLAPRMGVAMSLC